MSISYKRKGKLRKKSINRKLLKKILNNWQLYVMITPVMAFYIVFQYIPMYGAQIAFKNFMASKGIWGSPWVGFAHFKRFYNSFFFGNIIKNTLAVSISQLIFGFFAPIMLALLINEIKGGRFKKFIQTLTYAPYFLSTVVIVGMMSAFLSPRNGIINELIKLVGKEPVFFLGSEEWFTPLYVISGIWQSAGWGAIIYIAALAGIDSEIREVAQIDGASRFQNMIYINIPGIRHVAIILLILDMGSMMNVGFEKVFLMQNDMNIGVSEVISTYIYRQGLLGTQFSYSTAIGLFNSVINCFLLVVANIIARKTSDYSIW